jgi:transforming growth factor-beta-induced protein
MKKSIVLPVFLALAIALAACAPAAAPATQAPAPTKAPATMAPATGATKATEAPALKDIVDTAVAAGSFKTLATALQAAGLVDALKGRGPFTVFAPTDEAFAKLPAGTLEALLKDPKTLAEVLKYHVVSGAVKAADVVKLNEAKSLQGEPIAIKVDGGKVMVNGANVVSTDIETSNGIIHVIDSVILPPSMAKAEAKTPAMDIVDTAVAAGSFKTLAAALQAAGLVEALKGEGPFTVFAPTDEAFAKLPAGTVDALLKDPKALGDILKYHVVAGKVMASDVVKLSSADTLLGKPVTITVNGDKVMIGNANVVKTDIETSNGVIHVIDTVLLPPAADAMSEAPTKDIVDTAVAAGNFKTLAAALKAAGLIDALKGAGPFTVFAPTDEAFAALPKGTLEALLKDPKKLGDILKYHVVAGKVLAADAAKLTEAKTLEGAPIKISVKDGKVFINDAQVTTADILTTNGVIHVINKVILPPQ